LACGAGSVHFLWFAVAPRHCAAACSCLFSHTPATLRHYLLLPCGACATHILHRASLTLMRGSLRQRRLSRHSWFCVSLHPQPGLLDIFSCCAWLRLDFCLLPFFRCLPGCPPPCLPCRAYRLAAAALTCAPPFLPSRAQRHIFRCGAAADLAAAGKHQRHADGNMATRA